MKIFSFIGGIVTGVIIAYFVAKIANVGHLEHNEIIKNLGDAADFAAYYHDSGDSVAMDSCLSKREQAYGLGYRGWY